MIPVVYRSIPVLFYTVFPWCTPVAGEPLSVVDSFQNRLGRITTITAAVERQQTYRGFRRSSRGNLLFDCSRGSVYTYRTPGTFRFFSSDSAAYGIDLAKHTGWQTDTARPGIRLRERIDPLFRLFTLLTIDKNRLTYRGNDGNLLLYSMSLDDGMDRCAGFDALSYQCRLIESFDSSGAMVEKTVFSYGKKTADCALPMGITISEKIGADMSVDSIVLKKVRTNGRLPRDAFALPAGVSWRTRPESALPQQQFDTVPRPGR